MLHQFQLRHVMRHAQHPLRDATRRIIEFPLRSDPADSPVGPNDAELLLVRLMAFPRFGYGLRDLISVLGVKVAMEVLWTSVKALGRDSEHGFQVAKPGIFAGLEVPVPGYRLPGFHGQT